MKNQMLLCFVLLYFPNLITAQTQYEKQSGNFSLGIRTVTSVFGHGELKEIGYGMGGHFRIQPAERVNTEWFADIISTKVDKNVHRTDYHIGWSVMYYIIDPHGFKRIVTPYVEAGHCFDWTQLKILGTGKQSRTKFSTALQAGLGTHFNISPRFDLSLKAQYMWHLGKELHAEKNEGKWEIEEEKNPGWQGHLLISLTANYKLARLWKRKK